MCRSDEGLVLGTTKKVLITLALIQRNIIMAKQPQQITHNLYNGLKLSLWGENIRLAIIAQRKSLKKLSEQGNFIHIGVDKNYLEQRRKYEFQNKVITKKTNKLKKFIYSESLVPLSAGQMANLTRMLEIWKWSMGRDSEGNGKGVEMVTQPDIDFIFPKRNVLNFCAENGWVDIVTRTDDLGAKHTLYLLTKEGGKLPKIKTVFQLGDRSDLFKPDGWVS